MQEGIGDLRFEGSVCRRLVSVFLHASPLSALATHMSIVRKKRAQEHCSRRFFSHLTSSVGCNGNLG